MRGDVETIKERLDITEIVSGYVKLEKAGQSLKARCPFHNEKTASFFVSPVRQSYYCFGCGAKGDIFTFVEELEGLDFREALKFLADKAGVELEYRREAAGVKSEKDKIREALEASAQFFEKRLKENPDAKKYLLSRGISEEVQGKWRLGYAPAEWRSLYSYLLSAGYQKDMLIKAGLIKPVLKGMKSGKGPDFIKEPYDVFRDRIMFPIADSSGSIIAFSGRALAKETEPKYLNSPDTALFTKSEVLHGLDKAKEKIRKKNYAVLVEGQIDLLLSHQAGVDNTVASSGTAFTRYHLERLKKLSPRIILAFDGDNAGHVAAEKSSELALSLGLEAKVAKLPEGKDPADVIAKNPETWKELLRASLPAIEHFLEKVLEIEKDKRKAGKLIGQKILPLITLLESSIEQSHFVSLIAKRTGLKEELVWDDLRRTKKPDTRSYQYITVAGQVEAGKGPQPLSPVDVPSRKERIEERLTEVRVWLKELLGNSSEAEELKREERELEDHLAHELLGLELSELSVDLAKAETSKDSEGIVKFTKGIQEVLKKLRVLEDKKKVL